MKGIQSLVLGLVGVLVLGGLVFLGMLIATDPGDNLRLVESGSRAGQSGTRFVTAAIRNHTDNSYFHVQVEIDFLDEGGTIVGGTVAEMNNLGAGETWNLEGPVLAEAAVQARMKNLSCRKTESGPHPRACYIPPTLISLGGR